MLAGATRAEDRGEYLVYAGGCIGCHTDVAGGGQRLAGGRALKTPFGVFYTPNITADPETGIGRWSEADFLRALKQGVSPDGSHYYPAFPYTTYTNMRDADALAIWRYLLSQPPVARRNQSHDLDPPFSWRPLLGVWKWLFFEPGMPPEPAAEDAYRRGAYLVTALTHCGECHTPRNALGARDQDLALSGTPEGADGEVVPNITPDRETGIGTWSKDDLVQLLRTKMKPDFDNVQGSMAEAIDHGLRHLDDADLQAIATYILEQQPIHHRVSRSAD